MNTLSNSGSAMSHLQDDRKSIILIDKAFRSVWIRQFDGINLWLSVEILKSCTPALSKVGMKERGRGPKLFSCKNLYKLGQTRSYTKYTKWKVYVKIQSCKTVQLNLSLEYVRN